MLYIGADLGTSSIKLLLMDREGNVKKIVSREYPLMFLKSGWSEQNPADWWEQTISGLWELTEGVDKKSIGGISFGGQMHGLVLLDKNDEVIRPAILWNDGRSEAEAEYLNHKIGRDKLTDFTGNIAFAGFTAPKILWVKKHEPENFRKIAKILLPKDYIAYKLSGVYSTDYSDASGTLFLDVKNRCWSQEMLEICGISTEMLPMLYESYEPVGRILPEVAKMLGFSEKCVIAAGAGDNAAAAVGTGTVGMDAEGFGKCNLSLGTSGTIFITNARFRVDTYNALHSFAHADGAHHLMGCILSAASCNKWWMEKILGSMDFDGEQEKIKNLGDNHVYFLPYLMGERSPHNDPYAKGAFIGMTMDSTRTDMVQAVLEGVAFALRDCLEAAKSIGISIGQATICGGGAKSQLWKRIIANVFDMKIYTVKIEEGPSYGAAILAAVACHEYDSIEDAVRNIVRRVSYVQPDRELVSKYNKRYQTFRQIYPALRDIWQSEKEE